MNKDKDVTLIIHGPLTIYTLFSIKQHCDKYKIVIVSPMPKIKNNIVSEIEKIASTEGLNISIFLYGDILKEEYNNQQNRYYHFYSVEMGLKITTTQYAIKLRSDEFYSDLTEFEAAVQKYPDKIITNDVFFRNSNLPVHPSDHLMGGSVDKLTDVFTYARKLCEIPEKSINDEFFPILMQTEIYKAHKFIPVEQYIGVSSIRTIITDDIDPSLHTEYMKKIFHIVQTKHLGAFRVAYNSAQVGGVHAPKEYIDFSYFNKDTDIKDIDFYDQSILDKLV